MSIFKEYFSFIWNGGLDPATADPIQLRQRRSVSSTAILLTPVGIVLMLANTFIFGAGVQNIPIALVTIIIWLGLYLQSTRGWEQLAASLTMGAFWIAPASLILREGFNTSNWVWMLPIALLATFLGDRKTAIFWTSIAIVTLWIFSYLTLAGYHPSAIDLDNHPLAIAISGPLILILLCLTGLTFRTTQLSAERKLQAHVKRLGAEVETRRKAEQAALAADRAKAIFLATVSHELRTPLNGVLGAGQLLSSTPLNPEQKKLIEVVSESGEILLDLINNVLDLSRLEAGGLQLEQQPIHIETVIKSGIAPLLISAREKCVDFNYRITEQVPDYIIGDAIRWRQIILNLCGNALKFTESGRIDVILSREADQLRFEVRDTGIGIAEDVIQNLFQPFTQAETSIARRFGGSGLGLTIVADLVQLMDGEIKVESKFGHGSSFTLMIPFVASEAPVDEPSQQSAIEAAAQVTPLTVLVTDDNYVNRMVASKILSKLQHQVVEAKDGFEALSAIRQGHIDVVLMDVQMPNMDGLTATSQIRAMQKPLCDTPIIGLTANAMPTDEADLLAAGMNMYLPKPVRIEELRNALQSARP